MMLENLESISSVSKDLSQPSELRQVELDYICECVCPPRIEDLIDRIDDIQGIVPPKAIDSDSQIAELIEPIKDKIPPEYLEAPNDMEQVNQVSDVMHEIEGLNFEDWKELTMEQRVEVLNELECRVAQIEHRPACPVVAKDLGPITEYNDKLQGHFGRCVMTSYGQDRIEVNSELIKSDDPKYHLKTLSNVIHEGRHSYQNYNLEYRSTHTSQGDLANWRINYEKYGYQTTQMCGFKAYWMQPVETDARKFSEDVLTAYKNKL